MRLLSTRNLAVVVIGLPTLLVALYLFIFAANRYLSESIITVKQNGEQAVGVEGLSSIFQVTGSNARSDLTLLQAHIMSMDMLKILDKHLGLRKAFSAPTMDFFFRLPADASDDKFLEYYRDRVTARFDDDSGLLVISSQGFTPEQAQATTSLIVEQSEKFINQISQHLAEDQMAFARNELEKATAQLKQTKSKMMGFQERNRMLDPTAQAAANSALTLELQARLSRMEADLRAAQSYMDDNSYQVRALKQQIEAAQTQLNIEAARGTTETKSGSKLSSLAGDYRSLLIELDFSEQAFKSATLSMETARLESTRKVKSLVSVASPTKPQDASFPQRGYDLLAFLLAASLVFGVVRLMVATIEDHLD